MLILKSWCTNSVKTVLMKGNKAVSKAPVTEMVTNKMHLSQGFKYQGNGGALVS